MKLPRIQIPQRQDIYDMFRDRFSGEHVAVDTPWILIGGAALLALSAALLYQWIITWRNRTIRSPWRLFFTTVHRLPLTWQQRTRLVQLAFTSQWRTPTAILVSHAIYSQAATQWLTCRTHKSSFSHEHRKLNEMSQVLFGQVLAAA